MSPNPAAAAPPRSMSLGSTGEQTVAGVAQVVAAVADGCGGQEVKRCMSLASVSAGSVGGRRVLRRQRQGEDALTGVHPQGERPTPWGLD
jgi:hypothetical protein